MKHFIRLEPGDKWRVDEDGFLFVVSGSYLDVSNRGEAYMHKSSNPNVNIREDGMLEIDGCQYKTSSKRLRQFHDWQDYPV